TPNDCVRFGSSGLTTRTADMRRCMCKRFEETKSSATRLQRPRVRRRIAAFMFFNLKQRDDLGMT
ncbi:MAG: hypothetical protein ACPIOQ_59285, partial [Promethearchaeia archaeon]